MVYLLYRQKKKEVVRLINREFLQFIIRKCSFFVYGEKIAPSQNHAIFTFEELGMYLSLNLVHYPVP